MILNDDSTLAPRTCLRRSLQKEVVIAQKWRRCKGGDCRAVIKAVVRDSEHVSYENRAEYSARIVPVPFYKWNTFTTTGGLMDTEARTKLRQ